VAEQKDITSSLAYVATLVMDAYYGDLRGNDDYFEEAHFQFVTRAAYGKLLDNEMREARALAKIETGFYVIDVSQDWLIIEQLSFTKKNERTWTAKLKQVPFPFAFDKMGYGVQSLIPADDCECSDFIRMSPDEYWKLNSNMMPITNKVYYYVIKDEITLKNVRCNPGKVDVSYVPSLSDAEDSIININKQFDVFTLAVTAMRQARDGAVVDETNNANKNKSIETEIDNVYRNLKTKKQ